MEEKQIFIVYQMKSYNDGDYPDFVGAFYTEEEVREYDDNPRYETERITLFASPNP